MATSQISGIHGAITLTAAAYTNPVTVDSGASILSQTQPNALFAGASWSIDNFGVIGVRGNDSNAVYLSAGGAVTNFGEIGAYGTGGGFLAAGSDTDGVILEAAGSVSNAAGGFIAAYVGVAIYNGAGTVENAGTIVGAAAYAKGYAVDFTGLGFNRLIVDPGAVFKGDVVANAAGTNTIELSGKYGGVGTLSGLGSQYQGFQTLYVDGGAHWTVGGTLDGVADAAAASVAANAALTVTKGSAITDRYTAIYGIGSNVTVVNAGSVGGTANAGVKLEAGGAVTNLAGGMISGAYGVYVTGGSGTVENAGTIAGPSFKAVDLHYSGANRLIVDPGAVFNGLAVANAAGSNTIELSDKYGGAGTLSGLGSQYQGFQTVQVDAGAKWTVGGTLAGDVSVAANATVTIAKGAAISGGLTGIYGTGGKATIVNSGSVVGGGNPGVRLRAGGTVTNASGAKIAGATEGIFVEGAAAAVSNAGLVTGASYGILLTAGGAVTNQKSGTIAGKAGVYLAGAGTVENAGKITAASGQDSVELKNSGANRLVVDPGAVFTGHVVANAAGTNTIELSDKYGGVGAISGLGSQYQGFETVDVDAGAKWTVGGTLAGIVSVAANATVTITHGSKITNAGHAVYTTGGPGTIVNSGLLDGTGADGVRLSHGGSITNASGGIIRTESTAPLNREAIQVNNAAGAVTNSGYIESVNADGIFMTASGTVTNTGGTITGKENAVYLGGGLGAVTNTGSIKGGGGGVVLGAGGGVTNKKGAAISGNYGVKIKGGAGTVENAGTITAASGQDSVYFGGAAANRLIVDPGAVFNGVVAANAAGGNTIELSDKYGGVGAISGLGSRYQGFGGVQVDAGANWTLGGTLNGTVTMGAGATVTLAQGGTIHAAQNAIQSANTATIVNAGYLAGYWGVQITAGGGSVTNTQSGMIYTAGGIDIVGPSATVENAGVIIAEGYGIYFGGAGSDRLILDPGNSIQGKVQANAAGSNTIELSDKYGGVGTLFSLGSQYQGFQSVVVDAGANWTVVGTLGSVVRIAANATLTIAEDSTITASATAIYGTGSNATIVNSGSVNGAADTGVWLQAGGTVTNAGGGTITSSLNGVFVAGGAGAMINAGSINGAGVGVWLYDGGNVANQTGGMISGGTGVYLTAAGTVENAGTITGSAGKNSLYFDDSGTNRLIVDPGAVFNGVVAANAAGSNTIELSDKYGGVGAISGLGSQYQGFQTLQFDPGAAWTVAGSKAGFAGVTVQGFAATDMLDLTDLPFAAGETAKLATGNVLDILSSRKVVLDTIKLAATDSFTGDVFRVATDGTGGTFVAIASPATALWQGSAGGLWSNRLDWSNGVEPRLATVNAFIDPAESAPYTVTDSVTASVHSLTIDSANATLALSGRLTAAGGVTVTAGAIALAAGTITGPVSVGAGAQVTGKGAITGAVTDNGLVEALGGALDITGAVTGRGVLSIGSGASLELGAAANGVSFAAGTGTLILNVPADSFGGIGGLAIGDRIDLKDKAANGFSYSGDTLTVTDTVKTRTTTVAILTLAGSFAGEHFVLSSDGAKGTDITLAAGPAAIPGVGVAARQAALFSESVAAQLNTLSAFAELSSLNGASYAAPPAIAASAHR